MVARPRQAHLVLKSISHHILDAQNSAKEVESAKGAGQGSSRSTLGREGETQGWGVQCGGHWTSGAGLYSLD